MSRRIDRSKFPGFVYYSDVSLVNDRSATAIWPIAIMEYVVLAVLRSLAAARNGTVGFGYLYSRWGDDGCGFLIPLPPGARLEVDNIRVSEIICGCSFYLSLYSSPTADHPRLNAPALSGSNVGIFIDPVQVNLQRV